MTTSLDHQMAAILLRLEMVSHGSTQAWNASGGHSGEPDDRMVLLVLRREDPPHLAWRRRYDRAYSEDGRRAIYEAAKDELESWVRRTAALPEDMAQSDEELILKDYEGQSPDVIGVRLGWHPARVRRLRVKHNLGSEDGLPLDEAILSRADRLVRARDLKDRGLSLRQIALHLGCGVATISRDLAA